LDWLPPEPAITVTVPVSPGKHWAKPLLFTDADVAIFPLQLPVVLPMHQVTLVSGTTFDELL
jgi:hypothetical protein